MRLLLLLHDWVEKCWPWGLLCWWYLASSGTHAPTPFAFQHQVDILDSGDSDDKAKKVWQPTNARGHTSIQLGSWPLDFLGVPMMRNINRCLKTCLLLHHASWAKTTVAKDNIAEAALALEQACLCRVLSWNVTVRFKTPTILTAWVGFWFWPWHREFGFLASCLLGEKDMWQLQIARLMCCTTWWVQHGSRVSRSTSFKVLQIFSILTRQKPEGGWYAWKWRRRILKFWAVKSGRLCGFPLQFCLRLPGKSALFEREVGCKDPSRQSTKQQRSRAWHQSFACWWCNKM